MKYQVIDDETLQERDLAPQGEHQFEVIRAEELLSKKQIPMIKLTLKIVRNESTYWVVDYLSESILWKIKHFMAAIGLKDNYSIGELSAEDCLGRNGMVKIVQEYSDKYGIQAIVSKYISTMEKENV